jgi:hypothetical protein
MILESLKPRKPAFTKNAAIANISILTEKNAPKDPRIKRPID